MGSGTVASVDRSRRASVVGGFAWSCPFPPAADVAGIDLAVVTLRLAVDAKGRLERASVVQDPGHGFAEAAKPLEFDDLERALERVTMAGARANAAP